MEDYTHSKLIRSRLQSILIPCVNQHDSTVNHFHDPVTINGQIDDPPCASDCYLVNTSTWTATAVPYPSFSVTSGVFHEDHKKGNLLSNYADAGLGEGYANVCFLEAISYKNAGQNIKASSLYQIGTSKWDGRGFNDSAYASPTSPKLYDAYKMALCIIASMVVNGTLPTMYSDLDNQLTRQQGEDGGISSQYTATANHVGSENCETTAMTLIAYNLKSKMPET